MLQGTAWTIKKTKLVGERGGEVQKENIRTMESKMKKMAVFIPRTHYPSGRTWANVL